MTTLRSLHGSFEPDVQKILWTGKVASINAPISIETSGKRRVKVGKETGITERSVQRNWQSLQNEGLLKRMGGRKIGHWELL